MTRRIFATLLVWFTVFAGHAIADELRRGDQRGGKLRDLNGYFPFKQVASVQQWNSRQAQIRRRILVSNGLWPLPTKAPLNPVIHGRVQRDDYVVDRVYFESKPNHFVTGSLYRPKNATGPMPAILSPHGHWKEGRFYDAGEDLVKQEISSGAESFPISGRYPIQARAVQLARMGCIVFVYDMTGNADSVQLPHRSSQWRHLDRKQDWGFMSVQADLRLQNPMGLQTWNSIRAIDFLLGLDDTDPDRIGVTGASGGGTQSMIVAAVDDRIAAAMPCVMVSTAMQGGCSCENAPLLRIDQGNIDIAAAIAPRPLGLTAADDWTIELKTKGFPDLVQLYAMLGHRDRLTGAFHTEFKHNYNQVNRLVMYEFFNRHFGLEFGTPIQERDFKPLSKEEATVWTKDYPKPSDDHVGDSHQIQLLRQTTESSEQQISRLVPNSQADLESYREIVGGGWETILGRPFKTVGNIAFHQSSETTDAKTRIRHGDIVYADQQESLPAMIYEPLTGKTGTVVRVTDSGKTKQADESIKALVKEGFTVIDADLFGQGEFLPDGKQLESQRLHAKNSRDAWRDFSGYTYGYNHSLFALRVHDTLSLIRYAKSISERVHLLGSGAIAGPIAAAAASQARNELSEVTIDTKGFSFSNVDRHDHPMFVPGSVKYLGVDGLLSLIAPTRLTVHSDTTLAVTRQAYDAAGGSLQLTLAGEQSQE